MSTPQERINELLELKADPSVRAQMDYVDQITTEMAQHCTTQAGTYAAAELLDQVLTLLAWERLRTRSAHPTTGSITYLGTGHRPGGDAA